MPQAPSLGSGLSWGLCLPDLLEEERRKTPLVDCFQGRENVYSPLELRTTAGVNEYGIMTKNG